MIQVSFHRGPFRHKSELHAFLSELSHGSGAQFGHTLFLLAGGALRSAGNWSEIPIKYSFAILNSGIYTGGESLKQVSGLQVHFGESLFLRSCLGRK